MFEKKKHYEYEQIRIYLKSFWNFFEKNDQWPTQSMDLVVIRKFMKM